MRPRVVFGPLSQKQLQSHKYLLLILQLRAHSMRIDIGTILGDDKTSYSIFCRLEK